MDYFKDKDKEKIIKEFEKKFGNQINLDPEYSDIINENFWDVIEGL